MFQNREIFGPYYDGVNTVYGDPLAIYRLLVAGLDGTPNLWLGRRASDDALERAEAEERCLAAARVAFQMVPFDRDQGTGALDQDVEVALDTYLAWIAAKK